jgi:hypothetical protein
MVPTSTWHQFESDGVILMPATPQPPELFRLEIADARTAEELSPDKL